MLSSLSLVIPLKLTLVSPFDPQLRIHPGEMAIRQIVVIWLLPEGLSFAEKFYPSQGIHHLLGGIQSRVEVSLVEDILIKSKFVI